jgi:RNA polymerase sigma-70 factor (ECF subfamily)
MCYHRYRQREREAPLGLREETVGFRDQTDMGGTADVFLTTHWSLVERAKSDDDDDKLLIGVLLEKYWKPVYCYLRHRGYGNELAKDLTQGFLHEVVLNRNLVQRADQTKGRFRTFLLHALNQYIINEERRKTAKKRIPQDKLVPLEFVEPPELPEAVTGSSPEDCYNYAWLAALLDQVLSTVEADCSTNGMEVYWRVFYERVAQPILHESKPPTIPDICRRHGIADKKNAYNMVTTVKRRLRNALERQLRVMAASEDEVQQEYAEILKFFPVAAQNTE